MAKKKYKISEQQRLLDAWDEIGSITAIHGYDLDLDQMKHLIYDTYRYFWEKREDDFISREDLPIYKCIGQYIKFEYFPDNMPESVAYTLLDFAAGLCLAIETGFDVGYLEETLVLGYWSDGGPSIAPHTEVHMSSYEEYEKGFEEDREGFREWLDEYDDEEEDSSEQE